MADKFFTWTVELQVHESWVADGFDLTDDRAHDMLAANVHGDNYLYGTYNDLKAKVLKSPSVKSIRKVQGY